MRTQMRNRELVYLALRIVLEKSIREKETICSSYKTTEIYSYTNQTVVNDSNIQVHTVFQLPTFK